MSYEMLTSPTGRDWYARLRAEWDPIVAEVRRLGVPCHEPDRSISDVGGGLVILELPLSEDPDHVAWIGVGAGDDEDGPYLWTAKDMAERSWVGGYAYRYVEAGPDGRYSDRIMVRIAEPDDETSVAEAIRDAWRLLKEAPCPNLL